MIERHKSDLLKMMKSMVKMDFVKTPMFYFLLMFKSEMEKLDIPQDVAEVALQMTVTLPGLGTDFMPHKEWLESMATCYAQGVQKMIFISDEFGLEVFKNLIKSMSLTVE